MDSSSPQRLSADNSPMQVDPQTPENQGIVITGVPPAPMAQRYPSTSTTPTSSADIFSNNTPAAPTTTTTTTVAATTDTSTANPTGTTATSAPTTSSNEPSTSTVAAAGDSENPLCGVDESFLAALPENIREEVIGEQRRLQRIRQVYFTLLYFDL